MEKFEKEFLSGKRRTVVDNKPEGYLSTLDAVEAISCTKTNTGKLLQLVREGFFKPILWREGKGLSKLLFSEKELKEYRMEKLSKKREASQYSEGARAGGDHILNNLDESYEESVHGSICPMFLR